MNVGGRTVCSPGRRVAWATRSPAASRPRARASCCPGAAPTCSPTLAGEIGGEVAPADLSDPDAVRALAAAHGDVDILDRERRRPGIGPAADLRRDEQIERALLVNLHAPIILTHALAPQMVKRGAGHIVFMSSLAGKTGDRGQLALQRDEVRPARLRRGDARRAARHRRRRVDDLPRLHPRRRDVRRRERQAAVRRRHEDTGGGRRGDAAGDRAQPRRDRRRRPSA